MSKDRQDYIDTIGKCANCGVEFHIHKEQPSISNVVSDEMQYVVTGRKLIKILSMLLDECEDGKLNRTGTSIEGKIKEWVAEKDLFQSLQQQNTIEPINDEERPNIQDFFQPETNIQAVNDAYYHNKELFQYCQALDNYIDGIESKANNSVDKCQYVIDIICKHLDSHKELYLISGNTSYTGVELAKEIENKTEVGINLLDNIFDILVDKFSVLKNNSVEGEAIDWVKRAKHFEDEFDAANKEIIYLKNKDADKWIDVNDNLPDYDVKVLVIGEQMGMNPQMGGAYICIAKRQDLSKTSMSKDVHRHQDKNQFSRMSYVTHWQPLPNPPKK